MPKMSGFSWPQLAHAKLFDRSEPRSTPDQPLMIVIGIGTAVLCITIAYTLLFFGLKWRKARAAQRRKGTKGEVKTIELVDHEHSRAGSSPYVGGDHQGGHIGDSRSARSSSELPAHYSRVIKEDGKHDFVEIDISSGKVRE
ncbi:unnamed protein product [Alternaria alternata]